MSRQRSEQRSIRPARDFCRAHLAWLTTFSGLALLVAAGCGPMGEDDPGETHGGGKADRRIADGQALRFAAACSAGDRLSIAAVGDIMSHTGMQQQAYRDPDGWRSLWRDIEGLLAEADLTYGNLETPTARGINSRGEDVGDPGKVFTSCPKNADGWRVCPRNAVYTGYPMFNAHPSLVTDLVRAGFDVVSTANNHSLDRRGIGVDRSIDELRAGGLAHFGTRKRDEPAQWYTITERSGFSIAWVACTYGTNGIPDTHGQVLYCYQRPGQVEGLVRELAARADVDAVIVTPHWGAEYDTSPNSNEITFGRRLLDAGATAIIGSHPHVTQPWERYVTADGREGFIIYSLGNFISAQSQLNRRSTVLLYLGLVRDPVDGETRISGVRYTPLHVNRPRTGEYVLEALWPGGRASDSFNVSTRMFGHENARFPSQPLDLGGNGGNCTGEQVASAWTPQPAYTGQDCYDHSSRQGDPNRPYDPQGDPWQDYSMYRCVDTSAFGFAHSACAGKDKAGYCAGNASIRCCVM